MSSKEHLLVTEEEDVNKSETDLDKSVRLTSQAED